MKIGIEDRRKVAVLVGLVVVSAILVGQWVVGGSGVPESDVRNSRRPASQTSIAVVREDSVDPMLRLGALRETEATNYVGSGRNIFRVEEEQPNTEVDRKADVKVPDPPKVVEIPPIPLSFFGFSRKGGMSTVFLLKGEDVFLAREGDIVDRRYKIVRVHPDAVDVEDLLGERRARLVLRRG
jgi:hypothetical protein